MKIQIFNRWGEIVYFSEDKNDGWEGMDVPAGIYSYLIRVEFKDYRIEEHTGFISLIR